MREHGTAGIAHGMQDLPSVWVDAYNAELYDPSGQGFLGDRASNRAFTEILEDWRGRILRGGDSEDPLTQALGKDCPASEIERSELDNVLQAADANLEAAGLVHSAMEEFAQEMAGVVRRFLRMPSWRGTERIVIGGGFLEARIGLMTVGRVGVLLKAAGETAQLSPVSRHPDDAALCGAAHLAPLTMLQDFDAVLAADIGGTKMRAGLVTLGRAETSDLSNAEVLASERWRHAGEKVHRDVAVERLADMLKRLAERAAKEGLHLAPFVGVGCPGIILACGTIERGGQNLPGGGWEGEGFNLPSRLTDALGQVGDQQPVVVMHNDAVVQGLSETPMMQQVDHWGVLTIGTGLGNARFTNRQRNGG